MGLLNKHNLWMGLHKDHQWVILDRNFPANNDGRGSNRKLYFVKCSVWSIFIDLRSNWISPNYTYIISDDFEFPELELFKKDINFSNIPNHYSKLIFSIISTNQFLEENF